MAFAQICTLGFSNRSQGACHVTAQEARPPEKKPRHLSSSLHLPGSVGSKHFRGETPRGVSGLRTVPRGAACCLRGTSVAREPGRQAAPHFPCRPSSLENQGCQLWVCNLKLEHGRVVELCTPESVCGT